VLLLRKGYLLKSRKHNLLEEKSKMKIASGLMLVLTLGFICSTNLPGASAAEMTNRISYPNIWNSYIISSTDSYSTKGIVLDKINQNTVSGVGKSIVIEDYQPPQTTLQEIFQEFLKSFCKVIEVLAKIIYVFLPAYIGLIIWHTLSLLEEILEEVKKV
jgi:hypothetical protein